MTHSLNSNIPHYPADKTSPYTPTSQATRTSKEVVEKLPLQSSSSHHQQQLQKQQQQQPRSVPINSIRNTFLPSWASTSSNNPGSPSAELHDDLFGLKIPFSSSFDGRSEYEVVLDDGTLQKRTVSLTTVMTRSYTSSTYDDQINEEQQQHPAAMTSPPFLPSEISNNGTSRHNYYNETSPLLASIAHKNQGRPPPPQQQRPRRLLPSSDDDEDEPDDKEEESDFLKKSTCSSINSSWPKLTDVQKRIIKCSIAYMLGSLFTFITPLNTMVGGPDVASHLAATVTVFFNPAKTVGGMVEAARYGWLFTVCSLVLCLVSLRINDHLLSQGWYLMSYSLTLGGWIGMSSFVIAYFKGLVNKPSIATASALAFIITLSTLVREASPDRTGYSFRIIRQLFVLVAIGTIISVVVCLVLWPESATKKLRSNMNDSMMSVRVLLKLLTKTFLLDADLPNFTSNQKLQQAIKAHQSGFATLKKSLDEARLEFILPEGYEEIVASLQRLERHVSGLRSSCGLQFEVLHSPLPAAATAGKSASVQTHSLTQTYSVRADEHRKKFEDDLRREEQDEEEEEEEEEEEIGSSTGQKHHRRSELVDFIKTVRAPMKSLAYTCKQTIVHLQSHFDDNPSYTRSKGKRQQKPSSFQLLRQNLSVAMALFEESLHHALSGVYRFGCKDRVHQQLMREVRDDSVFLVYFFVFCLLEFAKELSILVECVEAVVDRQAAAPGKIHQSNSKQSFATAQSPFPTDPSFTDPNNHNTSNTLQTPMPSTQRQKFSVKVWGFFSLFKKHTVRYAAKNMLTAVALSSLAFFPQTQHYFYEYRMDWTLLTVMTLLSPTVGATNLTAFLRVLATVAGCTVAAITYTFFFSNPIILILLTWLFSLPCFWMILSHKHGRFGQVALLAYNLVVLYSYNHRHDDDPLKVVDVVFLAWIRCITVSLGVIIGLVVTAYIWPYKARTELRRGLSDLLIRLSWVFKHLSTTHDHGEIITHQTECQQSMVRLRDLLSHAPSEPRLKGPFPAATYETMLKNCQNIMDKFVSFRVVVLRREVHDVLLDASDEFMELVGNVLLYFYVLASALQLKTPMPPYLPPAERARKTLMTQLKKAPLHSEERYMAYYAYLILMEDMIRDLDQLGRSMKDLFGSIIPDDQWAMYFTRHIA